MGVFKKKNANGEKVSRDWSALLPLVVILMFISAVVGIIASIFNMSTSSRTKQIDEYVASTVTFSVIGEGSYKDENKLSTVLEFYVPIEEYHNTDDFSTFTQDKVQENGYYVLSGTIREDNLASTLSKLKNSWDYDIKKERENREECIVYAYDAAYDEALQKANLIANNTGKTWRITKVEEIESGYDEHTGETTSLVKMTFAVSEN